MEIRFSAPLEQVAHGRATILLVRLPDDESDLLNSLLLPRGGFASIKVDATVGDSAWRTSVFPDRENFLLLIARKRVEAEALSVGKAVTVTLRPVGS